MIKVVVDINENKGEINQIWAENVTPNTVDAAGIEDWLEEANNRKSVEINAISGPYFAYRNTPSNLGAIGSLKINQKCNVLDVYNQPINGLYVAGLNADGWLGSNYLGSGTAIGGIVSQGHRAVKSALGLE